MPAFRFALIAFACVVAALAGSSLRAEPMSAEDIAVHIVPPYVLGERLNAKGVWALETPDGVEAGYVFETEPLSPLPGFSGAPINVLVYLDPAGSFIHARLISHNEPVFVSGLGEAPFHKFFEQYSGLSISDTLVVGSPYGRGAAGSDLVYLDGVTKATASVRIAHESILAATLQVAREKMQGIATGAPAIPDPDLAGAFSFTELLDGGHLKRRVVSNAEVQSLFEGTLWEDDDPEALSDPGAAYLDLWLADLGPPQIARALLSPDGLAELQEFMQIADNDEPILVIDSGRHGLVSPDFVRNTSPDWIQAEQGGYPVALRDSDVQVEMREDLPEELREGTAMILRTDRRLGFDPTLEWVLNVRAVRTHGVLQPEIGSASLSLTTSADPALFLREPKIEALPPWREAIESRRDDLLVLGVFLVPLFLLLGPGMTRLATLQQYTALRLGVLAFVLVFIGWWGQGQLSILSVLAVIRTSVSGASFAFLLYDPFSLVVWFAAIAGLVFWGRGLFCGWLCPFGALQEFAHHIGRVLRFPQIEPTARWDRRLKGLKYVLLAGLVLIVFWAPDRVDIVAEIEPFKTAVTVQFARELYYVIYAAFWLILGSVLFKGFCRYVCPLGAIMAIGGLVRGRDWIDRRAECGSPCQLCRVKCNYGAIGREGKVDYAECFQCLDCVTIHGDPRQCVPLVLEGRKPGRVEERNEILPG